MNIPSRFYVTERNYGCRIDRWSTYKGIRTIVMQNELIRLSFMLDKGTDVFELLYKPKDIDFLWRAPLGTRHPNHLSSIEQPEGAFFDHFHGGWQEIFPAGGGPSLYKGALLGFHGEVATNIWDYEVLKDDPDCVEVKFTVRTLRTPFVLEKIVSIKAGKPVIYIDEKITNYGQIDLYYMWGHHPSFGAPFLNSYCRLDLPACLVMTHPVLYSQNSRFLPNQTFKWPYAVDRYGKKVDLRLIPGKEAKTADMLYATQFTEGWFALTNMEQGIGIGMVWDAKDFPFVWIWQEFGGSMEYPWYGNAYTLAVEPFTSLPGKEERGLNGSVINGTAELIRKGSSVQKKLNVIIYEADSDVKSINSSGTVIFATKKEVNNRDCGMCQY
ncbi:hypothetical protein J2S00_001091 [Caldalkalibacillus uzonensis]|uniref:DUF4432 family protein n=1 Tax=Caldalkalibacillus uzonensis TaxID=353224 RepID=A0ABU0CQ76_9BACI|nr:DUF4432 family protein [Caldalkalibacillus uzonensis]MDQ0338307.1 hypothetical protein [Caldalkalibacillus uzonensis]